MLYFTAGYKVYRAATLEWYNRHVTHQQLTSTCWRRFFTMRDCRMLYIVRVLWVSRRSVVILHSILFHYNDIFHFERRWNLFLVSTLVGVQRTWQSGKSTSNCLVNREKGWRRAAFTLWISPQSRPTWRYFAVIYVEITAQLKHDQTTLLTVMRFPTVHTFAYLRRIETFRKVICPRWAHNPFRLSWRKTIVDIKGFY